MTSLYIAIPTEAAEKLRELAQRERRSPRNQAAVLVIAGLARAGLGVEQAAPSPRPSRRSSAADGQR